MKAVRLERAKRFALILGLVGLCAEVAAQQGYAIQAGAYATAHEAEQAVNRLAVECWPVGARAVEDGSGFPYKVRIGHFVTYAEAWAHKSLLNSPNLDGTFIVADREGEVSGKNVLPLRALSDTTGLDQPDPADGMVYWDAAGLAGTNTANGGRESVEQLEEKLGAGTGTESRNRLRLRLARKYARAGNTTRVEALLEKVRTSGNTPEREMVQFVAAHADLHRKNRAGALEKFTRLVGNRNLPPSVRRDALRRAAGIYHSLQKYPEAWAAFECLAEDALAPHERQEARMQQAGLAFELVLRGKGTWEEVRALCQVVSDNPETPRNIRATAELMKQETLWHERRTSEALQGIETYLVTFGDVPREGQTARLWQGIFLLKLQRLEESRQVFEGVIAREETHGPSEKFARVEPRELSAAWLAFIAHKQENPSAREHWMEVLRTEFPESRETPGLTALFSSPN